MTVPPTARAAAALATAAVAFAAYPALRGYGDETGLAGAALYARPTWVLAHLLGMLGFVLVATGLGAVDATAARWARWGAFGVLPYYGAEAYGLHALGLAVGRTGHADMTSAADLFRYQPVALTTFTLGWVAFAVAGVRLARLARRATAAARMGLLATATALVTYLPQFFLPPAGRVVHGLLLAAGLLLLAVTLARHEAAPVVEPVPGPAASPARTAVEDAIASGA
ncbi:hypothetical protein [Phycicoccus sp.]|uniref:hypothetical protein n=1 Tax=Phycicoccus sp. TaxID=1902410 RepID=UPI002CDB9FDB|nr:hypothetical protein [Phycicoccus sp.]HMM94334.1 hypothetical protein [Phycicoccus sp.]